MFSLASDLQFKQVCSEPILFMRFISISILLSELCHLGNYKGQRYSYVPSLVLFPAILLGNIMVAIHNEFQHQA